MRRRRVLLADPEHLDVDRAGARDPAVQAADLLDGGEHRQPAAVGQLGQRRGRVGRADDHVVERERHSASIASLKVALGRITDVALSRSTW